AWEIPSGGFVNRAYKGYGLDTSGEGVNGGTALEYQEDGGAEATPEAYAEPDPQQ
ncbi:unnamed protein product, partial [Symbiodinium sp. KB8]